MCAVNIFLLLSMVYIGYFFFFFIASICGFESSFQNWRKEKETSEMLSDSIQETLEPGHRNYHCLLRFISDSKASPHETTRKTYDPGKKKEQKDDGDDDVRSLKVYMATTFVIMT